MYVSVIIMLYFSVIIMLCIVDYKLLELVCLGCCYLLLNCVVSIVLSYLYIPNLYFSCVLHYDFFF